MGNAIGVLELLGPSCALKEFSLDRLLTFVVSVNPEPERAPRLVVHNVDRSMATAG